MAIGPWQIAIILVIAVLVFGGRGKISGIMGDFGKGITSFKKGLKEGVEDVMLLTIWAQMMKSRKCVRKSKS